MRALRPRLVVAGDGRPVGGASTPGDAAAHLRDRPRFCPLCGASYADGLVVEYWTADGRVFHGWCSACSQAYDIMSANAVVGVEPEH